MPSVASSRIIPTDHETNLSNLNRTKPRCAFVTFLEGKNRGYANGVIAISRSLRKYNSAFPLVVATAPTVPEEFITDFKAEPNVRVRQIEWLDLPKSFEEAGEKIFANKQFIANFSKLRMWEFCDEYDKLVYLDADTLPMQNIDDMFLAPHFSGVLDNMTPDAAFSPEKFQVPSFLPRASLSCSRAYFNAGVFVFEPSLEELAAMKEALRAYPVTRFAEQDFLNDFFKGRWNMLPLSFNWGKPNFWLCPELCRSEAVKVVHFSGAVKPWLRKPDGQWSDSVLARAIPEERKLLEDGNSGLTWAHEKWWSSFLFQTEAKVVCDATLSLRGDPRPACYSTLISGDSDYYKGVLALAGSLRRHGCRLPLLVAHTSDVPAAHCRAMREAGCELRLVDSEAFSSLRGTPKQPEFLVCYNKLSMWLWEDYKLVIYLDADVVVNRNIDHLEKLELPLDYIAAAPDLGFATNGTGNRNGERYFNAGVMIFRPDRRSHRRLMDALMTYGKITAYAEQDFLNDYFADRLVELPTEYNFIQDYWVGPSLPPSPMREESLRSLGEGLPAVVHYAGAKPWRCRLAERLLQGLSFGSEDERQRTVIALDRIQAEWEGALRAGTKTMSRAEDALRPEWGKECGGGIAGGPRKIRAEVGELQCAGARVPAA